MIVKFPSRTVFYAVLRDTPLTYPRRRQTIRVVYRPGETYPFRVYVGGMLRSQGHIDAARAFVCGWVETALKYEWYLDSFQSHIGSAWFPFEVGWHG